MAMGTSPDHQCTRPEGVAPESKTWPYVLAFAIEMERKLVENAHKDDCAEHEDCEIEGPHGTPGWLSGFHALDCMRRIYEEVNELRAANQKTFPSWEDTPEKKRNVTREGADVGNFCMFLSCITGDLTPYQADKANDDER
jgi:hypothetical protein